MKALVDTNVLVDYLNGVPEARDALDDFAAPWISVVTWMEVLVGATGDEEPTVRAFLGRFRVADLERPVAERAVELRREHRIRLRDAIIWATAQTLEALLVTRNTRDFPEDDPAVLAPYRLEP